MDELNNGLKHLRDKYGDKLINLQSKKIGMFYALTFGIIKHLKEHTDRPTYLEEITRFENELKNITSLKLKDDVIN